MPSLVPKLSLPKVPAAVASRVTTPRATKLKFNNNQPTPTYKLNNDLGKRSCCSLSCDKSTVHYSEPVSPPPLDVCANVFVPSESVPQLQSSLQANAVPFVPSLSPSAASLPPQNRQRYHQHEYDPDCLDHLIEELSYKFESSASYGNFIREFRGRGDLHPDVGSLSHPAARLLSRFQKSGTPAMIGSDPWTPDKIKRAIDRGPHSSCSKGVAFLREEFADMVEKQQ